MPSAVPLRPLSARIVVGLVAAIVILVLIGVDSYRSAIAIAESSRWVAHTLSEYRLANEVVVARDGAEALDYLYRRGAFRLREAVRELGVFWAVINEAPPGSLRKGP